MTNVGDTRVVDPDRLLRPGDFDAKVVLALWCLRKSFYPLILIGLSVSIVAVGEVESLDTRLPALDDPGELVSSLLSPFALIAIAVGMRIVVAFVALGAAYPLTRWTRPTDYATARKQRSWVRLWWDRLFLASGFRAIRWSSAVRMVATERLGSRARPYELCDRGLTWAASLSPLMLVAAVAIVG